MGPIGSLALMTAIHVGPSQATPDTSAAITVTILGTGTPYPAVDHFGAAVLVAAGPDTMLFDCGRGTVIRLAGADVPANTITALFLTHLHSDHIVGIPDLWLTGWLLGRQAPLPVWGPTGTAAMLHHLTEAYQFAVTAREASPEGLPARGAEFDAREINDDEVVSVGPVRVTAFLVDHGAVKPAFGYRVDYAGHSVVISGDTRYSERLIARSRGVDCLIHAAWSPEAGNAMPPDQRSIASAEDAGRVFAAARPKLAVVTHYVSDTGLAAAVRTQYDGPVVIARDLTVIEIGSHVGWHFR
jgi:ribonuclease Z